MDGPPFVMPHNNRPYVGHHYHFPACSSSAVQNHSSAHLSVFPPISKSSCVFFFLSNQLQIENVRSVKHRERTDADIFNGSLIISLFV